MKILVLAIFILLPILNLQADESNDTIMLQSYIHPLDEKLNECSGLMPWKNWIWSFNDSGGEPEIYAVNPRTGKIGITVKISNGTNMDWEDITQDEHYIYVGDFGNNYGNRHDLKVYRIDKKGISDATYQEVHADVIAFKYSDQTSFFPAPLSTPYDCEGMVAYGDSLLLFSKDWKHYVTTIYTLPKVPGDYIVSPGEEYNCDFMVTGADVSKDGTLALIGYKNFKSYMLVSSISEESYFVAPMRLDLSYMGYVQTEGICFSHDKLLISCEETTLYKAQIWEVLPQYWKTED